MVILYALCSFILGVAMLLLAVFFEEKHLKISFFIIIAVLAGASAGGYGAIMFAGFVFVWFAGIMKNPANLCEH